MEELSSWLALHHALNATPRTLHILLEKFSSPKTILDIYTKEPKQLKLTSTQQQRLDEINWHHIEKDMQWAQQDNHHIITFNDADYPALLKEIYDPPIILYIIGSKTILHSQQIAIVGSRKPSHAGQEHAKQFAFELSQAGLTVTSGMAIGIDRCAHQGALAAKATTVAVLGCGVNVIYPKRHAALAATIQTQGVLVSEYPLDSEPLAENFPRRNRLISGLSKATLIVEATTRSGSLITARFASEQGRDVFAIPGSIHNLQTAGCHHLIKQGACLVENVQDILNELNMRSTLESTKNATISFKELDQIDNKLIAYVGFETRSVQYLVNKTGISAQSACARLLKLELRGYIKAMPGGYCRVKL